MTATSMIIVSWDNVDRLVYSMTDGFRNSDNYSSVEPPEQPKV